jgi:hypothetical protein
MSVDELIEALQAQKAAGLPGSTPVGTVANDNNMKAGYIKIDVELHPARIAKDEFSKGWTICRSVSRGGMSVLLVS